MASSYVPEQLRVRRPHSIGTFGCFGVMLGIVAGNMIAMSVPFSLALLFQRLIVGTVLGGLTGFVSSILLAWFLYARRRN
jgi:hypothetical protein